MSIEQTGVIDAIGVKPGGDIILSISDHLEWAAGEDAHLLLLQDKINAYLRFVESGEILEHVPDASGRPVVIRVFAKFDLSPRGEQFMTQARAAIEKAGLRLTFEKLDEGDLA